MLADEVYDSRLEKFVARAAYSYIVTAYLGATVVVVGHFLTENGIYIRLF